MKIYLDDIRTPTEKFDFIVRNCDEAISIIKILISANKAHQTISQDDIRFFFKCFEDTYIAVRKESLACRESLALASRQAIKPCIEVNTYQVTLPKTGEELFNWAAGLHNCMAGYFDMIKNNETIIYVFFQKNTIAFAVEIRHEEVVQASGKYNSELCIEEADVLNKWFELYVNKDKQRLEYVA